uniref:Uncharacterized protein n=1 Tax=Arundo donax TaxID=35708 RepID=A0A0A9DEF2_ARUDO
MLQVTLSYLLAFRGVPQDEVLDRQNVQHCSSHVH